MEITVYKRHSNDCAHKADRAYRRCTCRMMLEWSDNGKRHRVSAKTRSWTEAEQRARARMQDAHARTIGEQPKAGEPVSLDRAVEMFTAKKSGKHKETRRKYQYTLDRLKAWAVRNGRHYLADITESDLEKYQSSWTLKSSYAKRNEQERLRTFFRYCCASAEIKLPYNPTAQLEHFNTTPDSGGRAELSYSVPRQTRFGGSKCRTSRGEGEQSRAHPICTLSARLACVGPRPAVHPNSRSKRKYAIDRELSRNLRAH